jgi:hypothetical protein
MPYKNVHVTLSKTLAKKLKLKTASFRSQKQLQTLAMARAIMNGRTDGMVKEEDVNDIINFTKFINMDFKKI